MITGSVAGHRLERDVGRGIVDATAARTRRRRRSRLAGRRQPRDERDAIADAARRVRARRSAPPRDRRPRTMKCARRRELRERVDGGAEVGAREVGGGEQEDGRRGIDAMALEDGAPAASADRGWKTSPIHRVVDDVELRFRHGEALADFVLDHPRIADHRAQPRTGIEAPLDREPIAVVRRELRARGAPTGVARFCPLLEPHGVHAVARAVDVAAQQALVGFDEARLRAPHVAARGAREAPVAPQRADVERIEHAAARRVAAASAAMIACTARRRRCARAAPRAPAR